MFAEPAVVVRSWYEPGGSAATMIGMTTIHFGSCHDQQSLCELAPVVALGRRDDTCSRTGAKGVVRMRQVIECPTRPLMGNW